MRDLDMLFEQGEDESNTITILQCQTCGSEVVDEDENCCDEPSIEVVSLDQDGDALEYEF